MRSFRSCSHVIPASALLTAAGSSNPPPTGTLVRWSARRRSIALAGQSASVRLWDAHAELLQAEIPTGECGVHLLLPGGTQN